MKSNEEVIRDFYTAFQQKDVVKMQESYADTATFNDPVFTNLNAKQVRAMWAMLIKSGKDMRIEFKNINATASGGTAEWNAWYTFSTTGNKVLNKITASFVITDGKITSHTDSFSFYKWSAQALGTVGSLLGWTSFLKNKIRKKAKGNLETYMRQN